MEGRRRPFPPDSSGNGKADLLLPKKKRSQNKGKKPRSSEKSDPGYWYSNLCSGRRPGREKERKSFRGKGRYRRGNLQKKTVEGRSSA